MGKNDAKELYYVGNYLGTMYVVQLPRYLPLIPYVCRVPLITYSASTAYIMVYTLKLDQERKGPRKGGG
jgi:hypothetical protein